MTKDLREEIVSSQGAVAFPGMATPNREHTSPLLISPFARRLAVSLVQPGLDVSIMV